MALDRVLHLENVQKGSNSDAATYLKLILQLHAWPTALHICSGGRIDLLLHGALALIRLRSAKRQVRSLNYAIPRIRRLDWAITRRNSYRLRKLGRRLLVHGSIGLPP